VQTKGIGGCPVELLTGLRILGEILARLEDKDAQRHTIFCMAHFGLKQHKKGTEMRLQE
jgi:hypothetical protein